MQATLHTCAYTSRCRCPAGHSLLLVGSVWCPVSGSASADVESPAQSIILSSVSLRIQENCMDAYRADHVIPAVRAVDASCHQLGVQLLVQRRPRLTLRILELCPYQVRLHAGSVLNDAQSTQSCIELHQNKKKRDSLSGHIRPWRLRVLADDCRALDLPSD